MGLESLNKVIVVRNRAKFQVNHMLCEFLNNSRRTIPGTDLWFIYMSSHGLLLKHQNLDMIIGGAPGKTAVGPQVKNTVDH